MSLLVAMLAAGSAGLLGTAVGAAWVWSALRRRMDAYAAQLHVPHVDPQQLASLRADLHQLAQQQAMQDDIQVQRLYQWQCDFMRFVDESRRRQVSDASEASEAADVSAAGALQQAVAADVSPAHADVSATRELTDAEIDALPPELPEPARRKRLGRVPATPAMHGV